VLVSGPNVIRGYWNRPEATAAAFTEDGTWFRTGDVAVADTDGYLYLVDRVKDMIISGGENIYPAEVEHALVEHPAVQDCSVFGVPDARWGEVGRAVVVLRPGHPADPADLRDFLLTRIAKYKIPASFRFVEQLPRNAVGKVLKDRLRAAYPKETV
jgi:fatty-acyl-CoA synthase